MSVSSFYADWPRMVEADIQTRFRVSSESEGKAQGIFHTCAWGSTWIRYNQYNLAFWLKTRLFPVSFPATYLSVQEFSQVLHMQSKYNYRLRCTIAEWIHFILKTFNMCSRGELVIVISSVESNVIWPLVTYCLVM